MFSRRRRASAVPGAKMPRTSTGQPSTSPAGSWKQGQICRIRLHNFLTFDDVELLPTPQLNVIVGPNGTGKSSIVCAICIGLGGRPTLLGRAKELKDYVKHNKVEGWVEIELFNERGKNWAVRRLLNADTNSSSWMLDGKEILKKKIDELTSHLHIQLDNKCQFLPQDMVVEFARMDAANLLEETEKAIGPKDLHSNHVKLKELQNNLKTSQKDIQEKMRQRETEVSRNQLRQRDVERYRNRQMFITQIKHLKMKKCWLEYQNGRVLFLEAKDARKKAVRQYRAAMNEYQPIAVKHEEQEKAVTNFTKNAQAARDTWRKSMRSIQCCKDNLEGLEEELDGPSQELEEKKREERRRLKKVEDLQKEIQAFASELEKMEDPASITPLINEKQSRMRAISKEVTDLQHQLQGIADQREEYIQHIRRCEDELGQMQNVRNQRLSLLQRIDTHTHDAVIWLERNRNMFKQHIFEPILLNVNVRDVKYTSQVEAVLSGKDFFSFVTQTQEDKSTLLRELHDRQRLKINVVLAPKYRLSEYRPDIPSDTLQQYGFAGMILEFIEAPEPQLAFYCQYHGLHNVPLADDLSPHQLEKVMKDLTALRRFFTHDKQYTLTRSRYDRDKVLMKSATTLFLNASIDMQRKAELEGEIKDAQKSVSVYNGQYDELQKQQDALHKEDSKLRTEKNQLKVKIDSYRQAMSNMSSRQTRLRGVETTTFDLKAEEEKFEEAMEQIQRKRVETVKNLCKKLEEGKVKLVECNKAWLLVKAAKLKVRHLMFQYRKAKANIDNAEQAKQTHERKEAELKSKVQSLLETARRVSGLQNPQDDPELISVFNTLPDEPDVVEERIHECQAQADLCIGIDEEAVSDYEATEKKIRQLNEQITEMKADFDNADEKINELKERWLTPLRDLLGKVSAKFSEYFSLMKCVGEVALHEDPKDFNNYAVKISVKFRDSEELQPLNAQRQSGGERSVSTMLYLMALQGITACPFRVVDEINQGMDPVNERRVFDLMVASTSQGTDTSQYFILTPKLLRDLDYTDAVTVHVVYNGQEMPDYKEWNAAQFLD